MRTLRFMELCKAVFSSNAGRKAHDWLGLLGMEDIITFGLLSCPISILASTPILIIL